MEEETGWRPLGMQRLCEFQPAIGSVDQPQVVYLARGAEKTDAVPDVNEAEELAWFGLEETVRMIERGEVVGAATVVAVYRLLSLGL